MERERFFEVIKKVPKAEIHLHLEDFIAETYATGETVSSLQEFLETVRSRQNSRRVVEDFGIAFKQVVRYMKRNGIVYAEIFFSVPRYLNNGLKYSEIIKYFENKVKNIRHNDHITIKFLADVSRTYGVESANAVLDMVIANPSREVIGIGLGGDERIGPARDYINLFARAKKYGLHTVAHAGEDGTHQSVVDAVELLGAERIGHGIAAANDEATLNLLVSKKIPLEIAPTSNIITGHIVKDMENHPVRKCWDHGVFVTLNTDDPTIFNTSLISEYWHLHNKMGFRLDELLRIIKNGFRASFMSESKKQNFLRLINKNWNRSFRINPKESEQWKNACVTVFQGIEY